MTEKKTRTALIVAAVTTIALMAGGFVAIMDAGSYIVAGFNSLIGYTQEGTAAEAKAKEALKANEEKISSEMYSEVKNLQNIVVVAMNNAAITPTNRDILSAYLAKPGSELPLVSERQNKVVALLTADLNVKSHVANSATQLLDLLNTAALCGPASCDSAAWMTDYAAQSCRVDRTLHKWIEYKRREELEFARAFTDRVKNLPCDELLYQVKPQTNPSA
jgi:hypothetical protein